MPEEAPKPAETARRSEDPYRNYHFRLEVQGFAQGHFVECSNIAVRIPAIPYCEAGANQVVRKVPGRPEYADITLRYGTTSSFDLWNWFLEAATGNVQRKRVSIVLRDATGTKDVMRWELFETWPKEWNGPPLDSRGKDVAVESLTLTYETIERRLG
jgi:phage tail-like protein